MKIVDVLEVLLDENNCEPIIMLDGEGKEISFDQVAVIPYDEKIYCVLKPINKIEGIKDDEAVVFFVEESEDEYSRLIVEDNELRAIEVFNEYYKLLESK